MKKKIKKRFNQGVSYIDILFSLLFNFVLHIAKKDNFFIYINFDLNDLLSTNKVNKFRNKKHVFNFFNADMFRLNLSPSSEQMINSTIY